jgi:hypothetical protein
LENCQRYDCVSACGGSECVPAASGQYASKSACEAACDASGCQFAGDTILGTASDTAVSEVYSIDGRKRDICISYVSKNSKPIRVQIWAPNVNANCQQTASRIIKRDSNWRGSPCCDCPDDRPEGDLQGGPEGHIGWTKAKGVTSFEVRVLNPCGAEFEVRIECAKQCPDLDDPEPCPCSGIGDCADGCECRCGKCQEPCPECCVTIEGYSMPLGGGTLVDTCPGTSFAGAWNGLCQDNCVRYGGFLGAQVQKTSPGGPILTTTSVSIAFDCATQTFIGSVTVRVQSVTNCVWGELAAGSRRTWPFSFPAGDGCCANGTPAYGPSFVPGGTGLPSDYPAPTISFDGTCGNPLP